MWDVDDVTKIRKLSLSPSYLSPFCLISLLGLSLFDLFCSPTPTLVGRVAKKELFARASSRFAFLGPGGVCISRERRITSSGRRGKK